MDSVLMKFNTGDMDIPYEIIKSKKSKYIRVSMGIEGMKVTIPSGMKSSEIEKFLTLKSKWICEHYHKFQILKSKENKRNWETGDKIFYNGIEYNIRVYEYENKNVKLCFNRDLFEVYIYNELSTMEKKEYIEAAFRKWYINAARCAIEESLKYYGSIIGVSYNDVRIKEQKTRWGSCSKKGNLNFNWKLIMAPAWVLNYVIAHELCHLRYLNHSKQFWNLVENYIPDYRNAVKWLKENGMALKL